MPLRKSIVCEQSGNVWTSKIGLYGQEDLGGQWTAFFRLESGFYANNGAVQDSSSIFNRGSFVGITDPAYGQLSPGHQYTSLGTAELGANAYYDGRTIAGVPPAAPLWNGFSYRSAYLGSDTCTSASIAIP